MLHLAGLFRRHAIPAAVLVLVLLPQALGQQTPRIGYVYPAGGRQNTSFEVQVGGQFLEGVGGALFSDRGVRATVIEHIKPMSQKDFTSLRDKLKELQDKRADALKNSSPTGTQPAWTDEDEKAIAELRKKIATFIPRNLLVPAIAETVRLQVTISSDAEPGMCDLRLKTPIGLSNPRNFCIDQLPEFSRKPAQIIVEPQDLKRPRPFLQAAPDQDFDKTVTLPAMLNGQIMPGTVNRFRFRGRKGQKLVVSVAARSLVPYLPDAVPGWFQATLALYDAKGKELAYDDDYRFHPDPVLFYQIPRDGDYTIEIKDAIYRGRQDFVYRIAVGELPFITGVFPLGCKAGTKPNLKLQGWNLPMTDLVYDASSKEPGIYRLSMTKGDLISNEAPFSVDTLPECMEKEPNDQPAKAQPVKLPIIVNGRIDKSGDLDVFSFQGKAGEEVVAEVFARRLDSPLDSVLRLTDSQGHQLAFNDDHEDRGSGLTTHHADSFLQAKLPGNGTFFIHIGDAQDKGGPEYAYRLRISPPMPGFDLRAVPASITLRGTSPLTVYVLRKDGFTGEIQLALKDAPPGFKLTGARIPPNQDQTKITLTAPPAALREPISIEIEGRATIQGREVVRPAVPAEDMMQAFAYRHLVPTDDLVALVFGRPVQRRQMKILSPTPVRLSAGGTASVKVAIPAGLFAGKIQFELADPPDGITVKSVSSIGEDTEIVLQSDRAKVKPGTQGNLIVVAFAEKTPPADNPKAKGNVRRMPAGTLPAIPFEIVAN